MIPIKFENMVTMCRNYQISKRMMKPKYLYRAKDLGEDPGLDYIVIELMKDIGVLSD
jgi:hypothetical protein